MIKQIIKRYWVRVTSYILEAALMYFGTRFMANSLLRSVEFQATAGTREFFSRMVAELNSTDGILFIKFTVAMWLPVIAVIVFLGIWGVRSYLWGSRLSSKKKENKGINVQKNTNTGSI